MRKCFFFLLSLIILASCKNSNTKELDEASIKVNNLYNSAVLYIDSLDFAKAISIYNELILEPDGYQKSEKLKDLILKNKSTALKSLNDKKPALLKKTHITYDEFKQITWYKPISEKDEYKNTIYTYFGVKNNGDINPLRLVIVYYADDWIFWEKAVFLIDGNSFTYIPENRPTTDNNSSIWETSDEQVDDASQLILNQLYSAKKIKYRLEGTSNVSDFELPKSKQIGMKNINDLYNIFNSISELNKFK